MVVLEDKTVITSEGHLLLVLHKVIWWKSILGHEVPSGVYSFCKSGQRNTGLTTGSKSTRAGGTKLGGGVKVQVVIRWWN